MSGETTKQTKSHLEDNFTIYFGCIDLPQILIVQLLALFSVYECGESFSKGQYLRIAAKIL
jgi:hypothetical protein